jgi:transcriptional regulator with XRE-family HTH domain
MEKSTHTAEYDALRAELRAVREGAGLSQRGLAARLAVPHSWVAKVESGERRIDLVEFCWFVAACEVDPAPTTQRLLRLILDRRTKRSARGRRDS